MHGFAQPEDRFPATNAEGAIAGTDRSANAGTVAEGSGGGGKLEGTELDSALQLLVERAQYITGATGTALALQQGNEMVCRASAGSSAPAVGARLQVQSGLTGESIARGQLLRCDNAETDPRVNLEACRALGIASIVVLPLLRRNGEVRGLFELFSDHPYAFEERDLIALERMAALTLTALDLAERRQSSAPIPVRPQVPERPSESPVASAVVPAKVISALAETAEPMVSPGEPPGVPSLLLPAVVPELQVPETAAEPTPVAAPVPEAMLRVQKCASCGFPVSEGRALCLDCEKKETGKNDLEQKQRAIEKREMAAREPAPDRASDSGADSATPAQGEFIPAFLANSTPARESWVANHVNLLAILVLILGILVAVVVFR